MQRSPKTLAATFFEFLRPQGPEALNVAIADLGLLAKVLPQIKIISAFKNPSMEMEEKQEILLGVTGALKLEKNAEEITIQLLKSSQLFHLSRIVTALKNLRLQEFGIGEGEVISGCALTENQRKVAEAMIRKMGQFEEALVTERVNPAALGGVILRAEDKLLDASIQRQLRNMVKIVS